MDTVIAVSGGAFQSASLQRRVSGHAAAEDVGRAVSESPPSGVSALARTDQVVIAIGSTEKSGAFDKDAQPDKQQVADAVKNMNDFLQTVRRTLQFSLDEDSGRMVVQIKDAETNKVIRQIPSEEVLRIAEQMDKLKGLLLEEKV
jgi:flagellar protein FlaG